MKGPCVEKHQFLCNYWITLIAAWLHTNMKTLTPHNHK